jgi:hypothetical protein
VASTPDYREAVRLGAQAAQQFDWKVDLRGLSEDRAIGRTWTRAECAENSWDFPCYVPRGRFDDGVWVSIEYSAPGATSVYWDACTDASPAAVPCYPLYARTTKSPPPIG